MQRRNRVKELTKWLESVRTYGDDASETLLKALNKASTDEEVELAIREYFKSK